MTIATNFDVCRLDRLVRRLSCLALLMVPAAGCNGVESIEPLEPGQMEAAQPLGGGLKFVDTFGTINIPELDALLGANASDSFGLFSDIDFDFDTVHNFRIFTDIRLPSDVIPVPPSWKVFPSVIEHPNGARINRASIESLVATAKSNATKAKQISNELFAKYGYDFCITTCAQFQRKWFVSYGGYAYGPESAGKGVPRGTGIGPHGKSFLREYNTDGRVNWEKQESWGKFTRDFNSHLFNKSRYINDKVAQGWPGRQARIVFQEEHDQLGREYKKSFESIVDKIPGASTSATTNFLLPATTVTIYSGAPAGWSAAFQVPGTLPSIAIDSNNNFYVGVSPAIGLVGVFDGDAQVFFNTNGSANIDNWTVGVYGNVAGGVGAILNGLGAAVTVGQQITIQFGTIGDLRRLFGDAVLRPLRDMARRILPSR